MTKKQNKEYLKKLIGKEIIRIGPTVNGDYSYTDKLVTFCGFSSTGAIVINDCSRRKPIKLSPEFNDGLWMSKLILKEAPKTSLSRFIGKKIRRIRPTMQCPKIKHLSEISKLEKTDKSYMDDEYKLLNATKYHIVLECPNGEKKILDIRYTKPSDWEEATH